MTSPIHRKHQRTFPLALLRSFLVVPNRLAGNGITVLSLSTCSRDSEQRDGLTVNAIGGCREGGGPALWFFYLVFPLLFCFKYTVPDVRKKKYTEYYPATMIIAVIWLAFLAEFMMNRCAAAKRHCACTCMHRDKASTLALFVTLPRHII